MQLPARIGKYELLEFLGGGMSHVYRARDTVIGRTVAVKILTEQGCADEEVKARFLAEARMAGNLAHDNILSIYDFGEDDQHRPFMVMEFLRGETLRNVIKNGRTGDLKGKLAIALQVARALEYIHTQKIVHRDIKPENVHINTAGVVKLIDFGIAKTQGLAMTRAGYVLGTPFYMAPEQVMGHPITEQVDVYAFGVMLFEIFTGVKPIQADTVERIFYFILNEPLNIEPLRQAGAPEAVCALVAHCTAKKPEARPQGFGPVIREIESILAAQDAPTLLLPQPPAPAPAGPKWFLPALLVLLAATALGFYLVIRPKPLAATISTPAGEMVLVPAGEFLFGENKEKVVLPAFYIDRTEVTNAAYAQFCKDTAHELPEDFPSGRLDLPVVNVTITEAMAYAQWAKERLPTEQEWEKAARGVDGRVYPWGNQPDPSLANVGSDSIQPATALPGGASPYGALNMAGNVWEFVRQTRRPSAATADYFSKLLSPPPAVNEPWYTIRGQSFREPVIDPKVLFDFTTVPVRFKDANLGFRCVRDAQPH
ncbi:MAG TPA: bifunctional serine/threonine-protein kinase/formylglycine-generating enzyme family protein [Candidatus Acidoferrales bacterium]|nr:bifunctional serine/threonine-protein kinase/formylglycine-generating enzyme family protein [Candidatus Acidoferrales bacterium]